MIEIEKGIEKFLKYCSIYKCEQTFNYISDHIKRINKYFISVGVLYFELITQDVIDDFVKFMKKTCKNITINKRIVLLKQLYRYLKIDMNFEYKHMRQRFHNYIKFKDFELSLLAKYVYSLNEFNPGDLTRMLIVLILLDNGIRQSELLNIKIKNIDFETNFIYLDETKTLHDRFVPFSTLTARLLKKYVLLEPLERKYLLWNYREKHRFTYDNLRNFFVYTKKRLGLETLHARRFRHTVATMLLESGALITSVQYILGHKDINTTKKYIDQSHTRVKRDFDNFNVLETMKKEDI